MAVDKLVDSAQLDADLTTVADGIRYAGGTSAELSFPAGMAAAARALKPTGTKQITENGTYDVTGKASVVVNVAGSGGGSDLSALDIYIADFLTDVPAVTDGALDGYRRVLVA